MTATNHYPNFDYPASDIFKYLAIINDFTIILNNGNIVKFVPDNSVSFQEWLDRNGIKNLRDDEGWVIK